jgi:hypothetical protein
MRRHRLEMKKLGRQLVVIMMLGVLSGGAFAQRKGQGQDKRPPKEPVKVITNDRKDTKPPPRDSNQPKPGKKQKP